MILSRELDDLPEQAFYLVDNIYNATVDHINLEMGAHQKMTLIMCTDT